MLPFLLLSLFFLPQVAAAGGDGPIHLKGYIRDVGTGSPLGGLFLLIKNGVKQLHVTTDSFGAYEVIGLSTGPCTVQVYPADGTGLLATKTIAISKRMRPGSADISVPVTGTISGYVFDHNDVPAQKVQVYLVDEEYVFGNLEYPTVKVTTTDKTGKYYFSNVVPMQRYLLMARTVASKFPAANDGGATKPQVAVPTWYPGDEEVTAANFIELRSGEQLEARNIELLHSRGYCLNGRLENATGNPVRHFTLEEDQPPGRFSSVGASGLMPAHGIADPNGKFKICGLRSGSYRVSAFEAPNGITGGISSFGSALVSIDDRDLKNVRVVTEPGRQLYAELFCDCKQPEMEEDSHIRIGLLPLGRIAFEYELSGLEATTAGGQAKFHKLLGGNYFIQISNIPSGLYLKDIISGSESILHRPLQLEGSTAKIRIVLADDGGKLSVAAVNEANIPVSEIYVVIVPQAASSEADIANTLIFGQTDQNGRYNFPLSPPGKYYLLTSNVPPTMNAEEIRRLLQHLDDAKEVELTAGATREIQLIVAR